MGSDSHTATDPGSKVSRRSLLKWGAGTVVGVAGISAAGVRMTAGSVDDQPAHPAFDGQHQAGIVTPMQKHLFFAAFDVTTTNRGELVELLVDWTDAARRMTQGEQVGSGAVGGAYLAPPDDTGEALGLAAANLTVTFGFGPTLFTDAGGHDRFGLASRRPEELKTLPKFAGDMIDSRRNGGDICVQACADDPQVALHAVRNLARLAFGRAAMRWSQLGYGPSSNVGSSTSTPRNLFGFKDGTSNLDVSSTAETSSHLWITRADGADQSVENGTYMVVRRISMTIETWDRSSLKEQEDAIGRDKAAGAPLSGGHEFTPPDFAMLGAGGSPIVPVDSHIALAHPDNNNGARMLRRGYNFTDGTDGTGRMDAGLFFVAFVKSPERQYVPVQRKLSSKDALSEYLRHTGSGLFFVPRGSSATGFVGDGFFG